MCKRAPNDGGALRGAVTPEPVGGRLRKSRNRRPVSSRIMCVLQLTSRVGFYVLNVIIFPPIFVLEILPCGSGPQTQYFALPARQRRIPPTTNTRAMLFTRGGVS